MGRDTKDGYYHDYRSPLAMPISQLVRDLQAVGLNGLADQAKQGEFDATREEADAWAASEDGQATFRDLLGGR